VENIIVALRGLEADSDAEVAAWAKSTLGVLEMRSPTSLRVALMAIRRGRTMTLRSALQMEMAIAAAFCVRPL